MAKEQVSENQTNKNEQQRTSMQHGELASKRESRQLETSHPKDQEEEVSARTNSRTAKSQHGELASERESRQLETSHPKDQKEEVGALRTRNCTR